MRAEIIWFGLSPRGDFKLKTTLPGVLKLMVNNTIEYWLGTLYLPTFTNLISEHLFILDIFGSLNGLQHLKIDYQLN